jgi:hypothetical protein
MTRAPLTASADPGREMPSGEGSRRDRIDGALASLAGEAQRLERLGLAEPLERCREQLRFWSFLRALFSLSDAAPARRPLRGVPSWPAVRIR